MTDIKRLLEMAYYNEMANFKPNETGLPMCIYLSPTTGLKHGPRIKVFDKYGNCGNNEKQVPITISDNPSVEGKFDNIKLKDVELVKQWIIKNKSALIDFYYNKISIDIFRNRLNKV